MSARVFLTLEARRALRTGRAVALIGLFALCGVGSPLLALLTPKLLAAIPPEQLGGMELLGLAEPDQRAAFGQYLKNVALMPLPVVLSAMSAFSGAAPSWLHRPGARRPWVAAAFAIPTGALAVGTIAGAAACAGVTQASLGPVAMGPVAAMAALLWAHLALIHAATIWGAAAGRSAATGAGAGIGAWLLLAVGGALPVVGPWTPGAVSGAAGAVALGETVGTAPLAVALSSGALTCALLLFDAARRLGRARP